MSIHVAARAILYQRKARKGLIGSVFSREDKQQNRFIADIRVPLVDHVNPYTEEKLPDIAPGDYLMQLSLPDGQMITQNFSVPEGKDAEVIVTIPRAGPHEWSTLHAMTGKFAEEEQATDRYLRPMGARRQSYAELRTDPEFGYSLSWLSPQETGGGEVFSSTFVLEALSELIGKQLDVPRARDKLGTGQAIDMPSLEDDDYALFRFGHSGIQVGEGTAEDFFLGPGSQVERRYLLQQSAFGAQLICLPTPWTTPQGQEIVEFLIKKHSVFEALDYAVTISDPMINTVLGYINMGAIHLAQRLIDVEQAQRMLFEKISFPLAATTGGYILVLGRNTAAYRPQSDKWKHWVENLDHWFDWLPDGAILNASLYLMDQEPDLDAAYEALMRAFSRGLPYFSFGLKQLLDGMRFFASRGDAKAQERLRILETIASRTDPELPFLAITVSDTWALSEERPSREM